MRDPIAREFLLALWKIHILHHAADDRGVYGQWMLEELHHHGYRLSPGTLYPILLRLESAGWFVSRWEAIDPVSAGRPRRRLYRLTPSGLARASEIFASFGRGVPA